MKRNNLRTKMRPLIRPLLVFSLLGVFQRRLSAETPTLETYRKYALTHEGDATQGGKLFHGDPRLLCAQCHSIDGSASKTGPDLFAAGDAFGRRDLVDAVLQTLV